jgi:hypothetical protein
MKLTRAAETIITEDSGVSLRRRIVEHEEDENTLQHAVDHGIEDYILLVTGTEILCLRAIN